MKNYHFPLLLGLFILTVIGVVAFVLSYKSPQPKKVLKLSDLPKVTNFEECVKAGYPVLESSPRKCRSVDGEIFIEDKQEEKGKKDLIRVTNPQSNQIISSPLKVTGEARGSWFFEASFPVTLVDSAGKEIAKSTAKTKENWMTEDFVPFEATISFKKPSTGSGELILKKDNPSGNSETEDELKIPVLFESN